MHGVHRHRARGKKIYALNKINLTKKKKKKLVSVHAILVLRRERETNPWSSLARQTRLVCEFQASDRSCLKKDSCVVDLWLLDVCAHTGTQIHIGTHTHTNRKGRRTLFLFLDKSKIPSLKKISESVQLLTSQEQCSRYEIMTQLCLVYTDYLNQELSADFRHAASLCNQILFHLQ